MVWLGGGKGVGGAVTTTYWRGKRKGCVRALRLFCFMMHLTWKKFRSVLSWDFSAALLLCWNNHKFQSLDQRNELFICHVKKHTSRNSIEEYMYEVHEILLSTLQTDSVPNLGTPSAMTNSKPHWSPWTRFSWSPKRKFMYQDPPSRSKKPVPMWPEECTGRMKQIQSFAVSFSVLKTKQNKNVLNDLSYQLR